MGRRPLRFWSVVLVMAALAVLLVPASANAATETARYRCTLVGPVSMRPPLDSGPSTTSRTYTFRGGIACLRDGGPGPVATGAWALVVRTRPGETCLGGNSGGKANGGFAAILTRTDGTVVVFSNKASIIRNGVVNVTMNLVRASFAPASSGQIRGAFVPLQPGFCVLGPAGGAEFAGVLDISGKFSTTDSAP
jgi:hypothetical protein